MKQKVVYLINPLANEGNALQTWAKARKTYTMLDEHPVDITKIKDLTVFIKEQDADIIVVAGGDGTINHVCRAIMTLQKKPKVAIFPMGFGNALSYGLGVDTVESAMEVLQKQQNTVTIDLLKTNLKDYPIGFFNISVGFDARVVYNRMNQRYIGLRSYFLSGIRSFFAHNENKMSFTIDHSVNVYATAASLVIANSPVIGQNVVVSDHARLNDGFLDCTIFSTNLAFLTNLRLRGIRHPFYSDKGKVQFKAKHIKVEGEPYVQIDGDPVILDKPLEVEILPKQVSFLSANLKEQKLLYKPYVVK